VKLVQQRQTMLRAGNVLKQMHAGNAVDRIFRQADVER
jgi:hypothetical protein